MLSEDDLALTNALQVRPRATWAELAEVLGCTEATAARRWQRLSESGSAWVTAVPGPGSSACVAFVGLLCDSGRRGEVAAALAQDPAAVTVELAAGSHDLIIEVITPDLAALSRYLLDRVDRLPGMTRSTVFLATNVVTEASRWRLDALQPSQSTALRGMSRDTKAEAGARPVSPLDQRLLLGLSQDGRRSWQHLAEQARTSPATARRRLERLLSTGEATLRCDVAGPLVRRPVTAMLWIDVPAPARDGIARQLTSLAPVRFIATIAGTHNLLVTVWLRGVEEIHRLEAELLLKHPQLTVADRTVILRSVKRMGHLLDPEGRTAGTVPLGPWATE
ncbi:Lrp/AsnC family transcriptional regulator [Streptacidiphilus sp. N1-10]|uniref:Lrp/AsnC family transcriptional regulator n=1 Tax=Streptacidiphilus jeojiensis TaxID=3229225 RepID=A0ABV6XFN0_9ACTN